MSVGESRRPRPGEGFGFEAILSSLEGRDNRPFDPPRVRVVEVPLPGRDETTAAVSRRGEEAFAEFAADGDPAVAAELPPDDIDAIRAELNLPRDSNKAALRRARRRFLWANHPDRRPDLPQGLANRRVAIANMLVDQAIQGRDGR